MSDNNKYKDIEKGQERALYLVGLVFLFVVGLFLYKTHNTNFFNNPEHWGIFGDYVGGTLNPILGFFSFMILLLNLYLQRKQLDKTEDQLELNRQELAETRKALERSAKAQEDSKRIMDEQLKTQALQQFDSLFTHMMDQLNKFYDAIDQRHLINILESFRNLTYVKDQIERSDSFLRYERYLFLVLRNIEIANFSDSFKKLYVDLLKASLTNNFLTFINIASVDINNLSVKEEYRKLLSKLNFFEQLILIDENKAAKTYALIYLTKYFDKKAYENSLDFLKIEESWVFLRIVNSKKYQNIAIMVSDIIKDVDLEKVACDDFKMYFEEARLIILVLSTSSKYEISINNYHIRSDLIFCNGSNNDIGVRFKLEIKENSLRLTLIFFSDIYMKDLSFFEGSEEVQLEGTLKKS